MHVMLLSISSFLSVFLSVFSRFSAFRWLFSPSESFRVVFVVSIAGHSAELSKSSAELSWAQRTQNCCQRSVYACTNTPPRAHSLTHTPAENQLFDRPTLGTEPSETGETESWETKKKEICFSAWRTCARSRAVNCSRMKNHMISCMCALRVRLLLFSVQLGGGDRTSCERYKKGYSMPAGLVISKLLVTTHASILVYFCFLYSHRSASSK